MQAPSQLPRVQASSSTGRPSCKFLGSEFRVGTMNGGRSPRSWVTQGQLACHALRPAGILSPRLKYKINRGESALTRFSHAFGFL